MLEIYRKFWLATLKFDTPKRFGYDWFNSALDKVEEAKPKKVDWLDYEQLVRDVFNSKELTCEQRLSILRDAIAVYTCRG